VNPKKHANKSATKKPRNHISQVNFAELKTIDEIVVNAQTGELKAFFKGHEIQGVSFVRESQYARPKGPKVLTRIASDAPSADLNLNRALSVFDRLFAVDTSYDPHVPSLLTVTCIVMAVVVENSSDRMRFHFAPTNAIEIRGVRGDPERIGWAETVRGLLANPQFARHERVGLIVDAHLDALDDINARKQAIVGDFFLPNNFTLIYASSDAGMENVTNRLIARADNEAKKLFKFIMQHNPHPLPLDVASAHFSALKIWHVAG
jgi:hypothetical protein